MSEKQPQLRVAEGAEAQKACPVMTNSVVLPVQQEGNAITMRQPVVQLMPKTLYTPCIKHECRWWNMQAKMCAVEVIANAYVGAQGRS